jgi:hypothetical protein
MHMRTRILFLSLATLALPLLAEAAGAPKTFKELSGMLFTLLASGIATLVALGIVIYLWGIASNMTKLSQGEGGAYRSYVFWGIAIIFVMVSIFGIVRLIASTFFGGGSLPQQQQQVAPSSLLNG